MSDWMHLILFFLLNYYSTCIGILVGVIGRFPLCQRDIPCIRTGIRVDSDLFLIPHRTSFF